MTLIKKCGLSLLALFTAFQAHGASVWKVSSDISSLYIGGTIHLLTPQDYPLPSAYNDAYQAADKIVFETNMATISTPKFHRYMQTQLSYNDGTTIDQVINKDTYHALSVYLAARQIPMMAVENLKPSALAMSLSMIELKHLGFTSEGVDQFYARLALQENKPIGWLEAPEEQVAMLDAINQQDSNAIINYALADIKNMPYTMKSLKRSWRTGDMEALAELELGHFKEEFPEVYQSLLADRNAHWMPQIEHMLSTNDVEMVMVGAMHLAGADGLLAMLRDRGYKITKM